MIPVVFIHFGPCEYADAVIAQAKARGNEVVFLNPSHESLYDHPFTRAYEHMSTNHVYFELACMVRWFILRDWMMTNGVPDCLYCDTDVLLFANVESEIHSDPYYHAQDFTLSLGTSGHTSYWKADAVEAFCAFLEGTYERKGELEAYPTFQELKRIYGEMQAQGLNGGVSDMLLLKMFAAEAYAYWDWNVGEMSVVRDGKVWDHNINAADGFIDVDGVKRVWFHDGDPYGSHIASREVVRFLSLHLQGGAKQWISQYLAQSHN